MRWDGEGDAMNPRNFGTAKKWLVVLVVSAGSTCVTCTSSMYTLTYEQITVEFGISRVVATLGLSVFVMGLGVGPMVLGPLSEFYGRRPIYVVSFTFFIIWLVSLDSLHLVQGGRDACLLVWRRLPLFSGCVRNSPKRTFRGDVNIERRYPSLEISSTRPCLVTEGFSSLHTDVDAENRSPAPLPKISPPCWLLASSMALLEALS